MKSYDCPEESFINGNYIPDKICDDLVSYFDNNPDRYQSKKVYSSIINNTDGDATSIFLYPHIAYDLHLMDNYIEYLIKCVREYEIKYEQARSLEDYAITERINLQKYVPNEGSDAWLYDRKGMENMSRCLKFMTYLNSVPDSVTKFFHQKTEIPFEKGLTLIFPSDWTHAYRVNVSKNHSRYLISGWFNYYEVQKDVSISNERGVSS